MLSLACRMSPFSVLEGAASAKGLLATSLAATEQAPPESLFSYNFMVINELTRRSYAECKSALHEFRIALPHSWSWFTIAAWRLPSAPRAGDELNAGNRLLMRVGSQ